MKDAKYSWSSEASVVLEQATCIEQHQELTVDAQLFKTKQTSDGRDAQYIVVAYCLYLFYSVCIPFVMIPYFAVLLNISKGTKCITYRGIRCLLPRGTFNVNSSSSSFYTDRYGGAWVTETNKMSAISFRFITLGNKMLR